MDHEGRSPKRSRFSSASAKSVVAREDILLLALHEVLITPLCVLTKVMKTRPQFFWKQRELPALLLEYWLYCPQHFSPERWPPDKESAVLFPPPLQKVYTNVDHVGTESLASLSCTQVGWAQELSPASTAPHTHPLSPHYSCGTNIWGTSELHV